LLIFSLFLTVHVAAASCFVSLVIKESDNSVKLIVLDRLFFGVLPNSSFLNLVSSSPTLPLSTTSVDNDTVTTTDNTLKNVSNGTNGTNSAASQQDIEMQSTPPATIAPLVISPQENSSNLGVSGLYQGR
jgi:hypothetical protein